MNLVASSPEGLEGFLAEEIRELGGAEVKIAKRFVSFSCDYRTFYRLHFFSRIAFRFYREVARFPCSDKNSLYEGVKLSFNWLKWLPIDKSFCVHVTGSNSYLRHSHFTSLQVKNAIIDLQKSAFGKRSNISLDNPDLVIHLHLNNEEGILSLQSTNTSLHKRGYRPAIGNAPLKENLAAGLLRITRWDGQKPLVDIMCGSGTFLIEGISKVFNIPSFLDNNYLFQNWIDFDENVFLSEKLKLKKNFLIQKKISKVLGCDSNDDVLNQAKNNIKLAGFEDYIEVHNMDFSNLKIYDHEGIVVCNPPYGKKLGNESNLINLYSRMGEVLKENFSGWEFWLLSGNASLTKYLRMKSSQKIPVSNGGIDCRWIKYLIR